MDLAVNRLLAERSRRGRRAAAAACLALAALLHLAVAAAIALFSRPAPLPPRLDYVAVQVIPAPALDVLNPSSEPLPMPRRAPPPEPPAALQPKSQSPPQLLAALQPRSDLPHGSLAAHQPRSQPLAQPPDNLERRQPKAESGPLENFTPTPRPALLPPPEVLAEAAGNRAGLGLEARSLPGETSGSGNGPRVVAGSVGVDPSVGRFNTVYQVYLIAVIMRINLGRLPPPWASGTRTVVFFHIQRDGSITDLEVCQTSGIEAFDLAVLRAVQRVEKYIGPPPLRFLPEDPVGVKLTLGMVTATETSTGVSFSTGC